MAGALWLPLATLTGPVDDVIDAMHRLRRSAALGTDGTKYWLYDAAKIVRARAQGAATLSNVRERRTVHRLTPQEVAKYQLNVLQPSANEPGLNDLFAPLTHDFAVFGATVDAAGVLTRSEILEGLLLALPSDCYCSGPKEHPMTKQQSSCMVCGHPPVCWP
jgi:hypothetical protein